MRSWRTRNILRYWVSAGVLLFLLVACGGGGGGGSEPPPPAPPPAVQVSGTARFASVPPILSTGALDYPNTTNKPIRGAIVEAVGSPSGTILASGVTDANGRYSLGVSSTTTTFFVRVRAQLQRTGTPAWNFRVADNTNTALPTYALVTPVQTLNTAGSVVDLTAASGWNGTSYASQRAAGPFAILDVAYDALQKVLEASPSIVLPSLDLYWSVKNRPTSPRNTATGDLGGKSFYAGPNSANVHRLYILGQENGDADEYDRHVVAHEFGHYLLSVLSRDLSPGGPHAAGDLVDFRLAYSEGWGHAWAGIAIGDPVLRDSGGPGQSLGFVIDMSQPLPLAQAGWYRELSLAYLIWASARDFGVGAVWQTVSGPVKESHALPGPHSFAAGLRQVVPGARVAAVDALFASQGIRVSDAFGSTETNSGGIPDTLPLYKPSSLGASTLLCTNRTASQTNKHGNYAYARFNAPAAGTYTFTVTGGVNPDFILSNATGGFGAFSTAVGIETARVGGIPAGPLVIIVWDFQSVGRICLTLTVS